MKKEERLFAALSGVSEELLKTSFEIYVLALAELQALDIA